MKVTFKDTSATQYDANADLIELNLNLKKSDSGQTMSLGKMYLGDRYSAAFLQLKFRKCAHVIICDKEIYSLGREEDITYLNIDPSDDIPENWTKAYDFIENVINSGNNITILCQSGNTKSAVIVAYYIMRRLLINPFAAVEKLKGIRSKIRISPSLNALLSREAKKLGLLSASSSGLKQGETGWKSRTMGVVFVSIVILFFGVLYFTLDSLTEKNVVSPHSRGMSSHNNPKTKASTTNEGSKQRSKSRRKPGTRSNR